jgi:hypothetical protein
MKPAFEPFTPLRSIVAGIDDTTFDNQSLWSNALTRVRALAFPEGLHS